MAKVKEDAALIDVDEAQNQSKPTQYVVTTDNKEFSSKTLGVQFMNGRALVNSQSIDERLGRSFDQVVAEFKLLPGYHIEPA